jgi:CubicO group peptidase (beta-lactamase class C family)
MQKKVITAALLLFAFTPLFAEPYYPDGDFRACAPEAQGMDSEKLASLVSYLQTGGKNVHSLLVIRNGWAVAEADFFPTPRNHRQAINSCTKSVTSALMGIAIGEGLIGGVDEPVLSFFKDRAIAAADPRKQALTIRSLLTMTAGMRWSEDGNYGAPYDSWQQMWESPDQVQFVLDRPMKEAPGTGFYYNSGASHLLSAIIQARTGRTAFAYAREKLFGPLGITDAAWNADAQGVSVGGGGLQLQPRDLAKIGWLYLNRGRWKGRQVVPEAWVEESTRRQVDSPYGLAGKNGYGWHWWMNGCGGYSARGYAGQYLFVVPEQGLIAVFTAGLVNNEFFLPENCMEYYVMRAVLSDAPLPANPAASARLESLCRAVSLPPQARAPGPTPAAGLRVSGRRFLLEDGRFLTFTFDSPDRCRWAVTDHGAERVVDVGMDGVARITDLGTADGGLSRRLAAAQARWIDEHALVMNARRLPLR